MQIRSITAPNPGPFTLDGTQTYLLGETAVIDPGPAIDSHIEAIHAAMPKLRTILITHRHGDHAPASVPLKKATGAMVYAPRGVLNDATVDVRIAGGESVDVEGTPVEVIATPGHTNEHVCFLTADGDLFTGDTVLGFGTTAIFPPDGHMGDYLRSLETLRAREPRRIFPAHGPIREDAVALIDEYIAHRLQRERQVLEVIAAGASTVNDMRKRIYPDLDERLHGAAEIQLTAHLIKLVEEGRAERALLEAR
ncbi:MAG TPA: MBL fold metallo-hydrolase [Thermoanaerobaculia bacterium]|nr:MBL fold metallo-hydrolase [Thermoanaerobaculia bacterium]